MRGAPRENKSALNMDATRPRQLPPVGTAVAADNVRAEMRQAAMSALKAQWLLRREAGEAWVSLSS
jgi:hypothetical protein